MTADQNPPIHPDVCQLIKDITEMADQIKQPFVADPQQVRIFNAAYLDSLSRGEASARSQKTHPGG